MTNREITLHIVTVGQTVAPSLNRLDNRPIEQWFSRATNDELTLRIKVHTPITGSPTCGPAELQESLRRILPASTSRPVRDIGLVFCGSWQGNDGLQGLMFDYDGFDPLLGPFTTSGGVPREGCAVFVDAFDGSEEKKVFTAIHELGHVFNLQHDPAESSFMAREHDVLGFNADDCAHLAAAARGNWFYAPGGANFGVSSSARFAPAEGRVNARLRLEARLGRAAYLVGECIILDLNLRPVTDDTLQVPCELDPGFERLRVWIETPLGERYLHRAPHTYCRTRQRVCQITQRRPLQNNPRIHVGAKGLNFDGPGVYRVWVEFDIEDGTTVRSEDLGIEILTPRSLFEERISRLLRRRSVGRFLVNKGGGLKRALRQSLESVTQVAPKHPAIQHVRYAFAAEYIRRGKLEEARQALRGLSMQEESLKRGIARLRRRLRAASGLGGHVKRSVGRSRQRKRGSHSSREDANSR